jgi:hypothetical protein
VISVGANILEKPAVYIFVVDEDRNSRFLKNVCKCLANYMASHFREHYSS